MTILYLQEYLYSLFCTIKSIALDGTSGSMLHLFVHCSQYNGNSSSIPWLDSSSSLRCLVGNWFQITNVSSPCDVSTKICLTRTVYYIWSITFWSTYWKYHPFDLQRIPWILPRSSRKALTSLSRAPVLFQYTARFRLFTMLFPSKINFFYSPILMLFQKKEIAVPGEWKGVRLFMSYNHFLNREMPVS